MISCRKQQVTLLPTGPPRTNKSKEKHTKAQLYFQSLVTHKVRKYKQTFWFGAFLGHRLLWADCALVILASHHHGSSSKAARRAQ